MAGHKRGQVNARGHQFADHGLLRLHGLVGVNHGKIKLRAHAQILLEDAALEDAEALVGIGGQSQIHARLEIF